MPATAMLYSLVQPALGREERWMCWSSQDAVRVSISVPAAKEDASDEHGHLGRAPAVRGFVVPENFAPARAEWVTASSMRPGSVALNRVKEAAASGSRTAWTTGSVLVPCLWRKSLRTFRSSQSRPGEWHMGADGAWKRRRRCARVGIRCRLAAAWSTCLDLGSQSLRLRRGSVRGRWERMFDERALRLACGSAR
jgi:hypothetical protein